MANFQLLCRTAFVLVVAALLSACATNSQSLRDANGIYDPYEDRNRKVHAFNKGIDRNLVRPVARAYATVVPVELRRTANNFSDNISMPAVALNSLLQGDLRGVGLATLRFAFNSTIGIGGLIDAASEFNVPEHETDFGETLYVWGVGEGAYVEAPFAGPSTQRASVGRLVDLFTNPLTYTLPEPERYVPPVAGALARLNDRARFGDTIDSVLYESADSYSQARLIYLQNRRFELGDVAAETDTDPYADPYEDPYAQ